ncbi:hypothetical protein KR222_009467 [Zaprionus bogoriensis]|nr:hypothetical protein KR222_009467 [Zaprionus bogoriensis]
MLRQWLLILGLICVLRVCSVNSGTHLHRYMLSDYRPQHLRRKQWDYNPVPRPIYPSEKLDVNKHKPEEPHIALVGSDKKVRLQDLLVRVFNGKKYLCMGTLITPEVVLTASTCFKKVVPSDLKVKTSQNDFLSVYNEVVFGYANSDAIAVLALKKPASDDNMIAKLCTSYVQPEKVVELPTYIRSLRKVHNQNALVLPLEQCRRNLDDLSGVEFLDAYLCVQNKKNTASCQKTYGTPLILDNQICGINVLGHNCPKNIGFDVYAKVMNQADFVAAKMKHIQETKLHDSIQ